MAPVMPDDGVAKQHVFFPCPGADVVDDQRHAAGRLAVADDADVRDAAAEVPGHQVAR